MGRKMLLAIALTVLVMTATVMIAAEANAGWPKYQGHRCWEGPEGDFCVPEPEPPPDPGPYGEAGAPPANPKPQGQPLTFGRYRGWTLNQVERYDHGYIEWLARTTMGRTYKRELDQLLRRVP